MKITELEHLKEGDFLIVKPIPEFCSPLVKLISMRVRFDGFVKKGEAATLHRGYLAKDITLDRIEVIGRYSPAPTDYLGYPPHRSHAA